VNLALLGTLDRLAVQDYEDQRATRVLEV